MGSAWSICMSDLASGPDLVPRAPSGHMEGGRGQPGSNPAAWGETGMAQPRFSHASGGEHGLAPNPSVQREQGMAQPHFNYVGRKGSGLAPVWFVWERGHGSLILEEGGSIMAAAPPLSNFLTYGEPHGPDGCFWG